MTQSSRIPVLLLLSAPAAFAAPVTGDYVFNGDRNWARSAPLGNASQSTTHSGDAAWRAIDGNTNGSYGASSTTHTNGNGSSWQVDLGAARAVDQINLFNRSDCCGERLTDFTVSVLDGADAVVWSQSFPGTAGASQTFSPTAGTIGNKVKVAFNSPTDPDALSLAEVQVIDLSTPAFANVALTGSASQFTEGYGGAASRAIDGNTYSFFGGNSVTHTNDTVTTGSPVFLEVALTQLHGINEVALFNRDDCCADRLSNFRLSIYNGATEVWGENYFVGSGSAGRIFSVRDESGAFFANGDRVRVELIGGLNNQGDSAGGKSLSIGEFQIYGAPIPEPAVLGLALMAAVPVLRRRRR